MYLDHENIFCEEQSITGSAPTEKIIDIGNTDIGSGEPVNIFATVKETFAGCTSVQLTVQESDTEDFAVADDLVSTRSVLLAELKSGFRFNFGSLPSTKKAYLRGYITVNGANATAGKIFFSLCGDKESGR